MQFQQKLQRGYSCLEFDEVVLKFRKKILRLEE